MSKGFTASLGAAELAGALGVAFGVLTQLAAMGLIVIMLSALERRFLFGIRGFGAMEGPAGTMN